MTQKEAIGYWLQSAKRDIKTAKDLYKTGHYAWALFIWQLIIERVLKALLIKKNQEILVTHNLIRLAEAAEIELNEDLKRQLGIITSFNLEARYDDYKEKFYHQATKSFTQKWSKKSIEIYQWLIKKF